MEYAFTEQDYLGGEAIQLNHRPEAAAWGMQWHCLVWLDCFWLHWGKAGEVRRPFTDEELWDFTKNVGIEMELSLGILEYIRMSVHWRKKQLEQVVRLKERLESI